MSISIIIPAYNEEKAIGECLESLFKQSVKDLEIIVIDDGSTDNTMEVLSKFKNQSSEIKVLKQKHQGPGMARNLGAKEAKGDILVFIDADMVFDERFIENLTNPIEEGKNIGTFSKEEYVLNKDNVWSKCWNINKGLPVDRMHPKNYPEIQKVFRAILRKKFQEAGGFTPIGYVDDHTLADKLGIQAIAAANAIFYHRNPETLSEIFNQARWIGKSEYKNRKIKNEFIMKLVTMIRYSLPMSLLNGLFNTIKFKISRYLIFKIVYDLAIEISIIGSFLGEQKYK